MVGTNQLSTEDANKVANHVFKFHLETQPPPKPNLFNIQIQFYHLACGSSNALATCMDYL